MSNLKLQMSELPDFTDWTRYRLESLLHEYEHRIHATGPARLNPSERELYEKWVAGLQQELDRRASRAG
jgi:hypothetical protein